MSCNGASAWPRLSDDPLEQFLLEEALVALVEAEEREVDEQAANERRLEAAREEARREARERLNAAQAAAL